MVDTEPRELVVARAMAVGIALEHNRDIDKAVAQFQLLRRRMGLGSKLYCREFIEYWLGQWDEGNAELRHAQYPGRPSSSTGLTFEQVAEMPTTSHREGNRLLPFFSVEQVSVSVICGCHPISLPIESSTPLPQEAAFISILALRTYP